MVMLLQILAMVNNELHQLIHFDKKQQSIGRCYFKVGWWI